MASGPFYQAGKYHVQVTDVALGEASTGNPQIILRVKIISGLQLNSAGDEVAVTLLGQYDRTIYLTVTDKSNEMILKKLRWAGWEGDRFETLTKDLLGRGCRADCKIEPAKSGKYAGQDTEKWDLDLPPLESKPLENKPAVAKKLNALFGKALKEKVIKTPAPEGDPTGIPPGGVPPEPQSVGAGIPDDDVPFSPAI